MPSTAPPLPDLPVTTSPVRSLWVRDNDVDPSIDPRGTGFGAAAPGVMVELVRAQRITEVFLGAHGAGDGGAVDAWTGRACRVLRGRRTYVAALGGDVAWLDDGEPGSTAAARWTRSALALGPFHRVHVDLAPWTHPAWDSGRAAVWSAYLDVLDAVRTAARGLPVDVDVPWWFATTSADDGVPHLASVAARVARVAVLVDSSRVEGDDGILARLAPSAEVCEASGTGFAVGVELGGHGALERVESAGGVGQDRPGGLDRIDGAVGVGHGGPGGLEQVESAGGVVRERLRDSTVYRGFAVDGYRAWVASVDSAARGVS